MIALIQLHRVEFVFVCGLFEHAAINDTSRQVCFCLRGLCQHATINDTSREDFLVCGSGTVQLMINYVLFLAVFFAWRLTWALFFYLEPDKWDNQIAQISLLGCSSVGPCHKRKDFGR